ncbi:hypothetical protein [Bradyrhizobium ivorense]|uniref:hypothetical protein n=1 Tax=Bradyrhizobium ivorense TaxID=2511166 RepID=UPI0010AFEA96|nr:hypothetical protein [Bradyrhizobium ivorense]VIO80839.1 hypothetical protein CI41S_75500 [Bradyrhizobium ivorense]
MDLRSIFADAGTLFSLVGASSVTVLLSVIGLMLLFLTAVLAFVAISSKPQELSPWLRAFTFLSLFGGMVFSAAGPSLALLNFADKSVTKISAERSFSNLANATRVDYVIKLIPYDPKEEPNLAIDRLTYLEPSDQLYSFVASYDDLVGYSVTDALEKVGKSYNSSNSVSAIIFPVRASLFPANARGLLQVIQNVEARQELQVQLTKKLLVGTNAITRGEQNDLTSTSIPSYRVENFRDKYEHYCELAREFQCTTTYSARAFIGALDKGWHPLGFVEKLSAPGRCALPAEKYCEFTDWKKAWQEYRGDYGARTFLIRNLSIAHIPGRIMIDFDQPSSQVIPDIGISRVIGYPDTVVE